MLQNAPGPDKVFSQLFDWFNKDEIIEIYCYGNCDVLFLDATLKYIKTFKAQLCISLIRNVLTDYALTVKEHFDANSDISLMKVYNYFNKSEICQTHNASDDAKFLKNIYENLSVNNEKDTTAFPEYKKKKKRQVLYAFPIIAHTHGEYFYFKSYKDATEWYINDYLKRSENIPSFDIALSQIKRLARKNGFANGIKWKVSTESFSVNPEHFVDSKKISA